MEFEWDIYKAISNWFKHGIPFNQAVTALEDPDGLILEIPFHNEVRFQLIGRVNIPGQKDMPSTVVVIYTITKDNKKRIISARRASRKERLLYGRKI